VSLRLRVLEAWNSYRHDVVSPDAGKVQLSETKAAFYAGAMAVHRVYLDSNANGAAGFLDRLSELADDLQSELRIAGPIIKAEMENARREEDRSPSAPMEMNPDHPVTQAMRDNWHKLCAVLVAKYEPTTLQAHLTTEDIATLDRLFQPEITTIIAHAKAQEIHLSLMPLSKAKSKLQ
jgi:hypothetical protein